MNIITNLIARIEEYRATNKNPCKSYDTEAAAEKATATMAMTAAMHFTKPHNPVVSAQYVVFFNPAWGKWVGAINMTELIGRNSSTGGYLGVCKGFYTF